ncbi:NFACT family protein [Metabacillus sp. GX 13764]|uniref:Rqc2 family fibronectin-binding protein n=1 Tax=Metabacillus kandeliae TaxID=2900151 RepID=UPI001E5A2340|nr:NFACT RNA binding domain-containing protein [Metabacillus kandeliae]MCD7033840.1 NFACT family protein [Metabacillus kandeliae]
MSFDGLFTYAMVKELKQTLENGKITRIHQPYKNELIIAVRAAGKNHKLLVSAHPSYARIHLTEEQYENPSDPPMFCMLLRKYIEGGVIELVEQEEMERTVTFHIRVRNELGDLTHKKLIVEIMGKHSNIILTDAERGIILDSIKHLPPSVNSYRTVLPGFDYVSPPSQNKADPLHASAEDAAKKIDYMAGKLDQQLVGAFAGFSPLAAKEVVHRAGLANRTTLPEAFEGFMEEIRTGIFHPVIISGSKDYFYFINLEHIKGDRKTFPSLSMMLDRYYFQKADRDRVKQQGHDLERYIVNELKKNKGKIKKLQLSLQDAKNSDKLQLYGELLTANMHAVKKGDKIASVLNYYDENQEMLDIPLNPQKTPSENAQSYYSKYQKQKKSVAFTEEQIRLAELEILYFEGLLQQLETASPRDIEEIREELAEGGYLKKRQGKQVKKKKNAPPVLEKYEAKDGTEIWIGKNNKQNEYLTTKAAARDELWFHTKDIPGSHVVIRSKTPSDESILDAANLAAYFSKARSSSSVPVDYTLVRHVKKPNGSKPGYVIYDNQQTVFVTPDEDMVKKLKKK